MFIWRDTVSKRAVIFFNLFLVFITLGILISAFFVLSTKKLALEQRELGILSLGDQQMDIIKQDFLTQKSLRSMDTLAKLAAWKSIKDFSATGGFATHNSPNGISIYDGENFPNYLTEFEKVFNKNLQQYTRNVASLQHLSPDGKILPGSEHLPIHDFKLSTKETILIGISPAMVGPEHHRIKPSFSVEILYDLEVFIHMESVIKEILEKCTPKLDGEITNCANSVPLPWGFTQSRFCPNPQLPERHVSFCWSDKNERFPNVATKGGPFSAFPIYSFAIKFPLEVPLTLTRFQINDKPMTETTPLVKSPGSTIAVSGELSTPEPRTTIIEFCYKTCTVIQEDKLTRGTSSITFSFETSASTETEIVTTFLKFKKTQQEDFIEDTHTIQVQTI